MAQGNGFSEEEISVAAYYVWEKQMDYETLCWLLAERELYIQNNFQKPPRTLIGQRSEQIFSSSPPYEMLCWLIGKYNLFI
ncbi:MAG: hypothetical protein P8Y97_20845, partial [Candidatus Lokiarchaeota archaeon]